MKVTPFITSFSVAAILLCGCSSANKTPDLSSIQEVTEFTGEQCKLPVISIRTKNTSDNVLDFVNKPVAKHVAEAIASWTPDYEMPPAPYYEECSVTVTDGNGQTLLEPADAQVKVRGNWTTNYSKKPLKIKFTEKHSMLGLNEGAEQKNWLLLAGYKDGSMLRDKAALYASREILEKHGHYAADSDLVQVEINGEYYGTYLLSEMQQVSSERVKITEPEKEYKGTDIGYFLEFDGYFQNEDELHGFPLDLADNAPLKPYDGSEGKSKPIQLNPTPKEDYKSPMGVTIKSTVNSKEQHDFIDNYVNCVYRIMYEAAYNDKAYMFDKDFKNISESKDITPQQAVENVVDVQSLVDMYIISELTCDADIHWSSFYMDADFGAEGNKKLTFEAPWDFDSSMGNRDRCEDGEGFFASNIMLESSNSSYYTANPWLLVLAYEDWYQDMVKDTWTQVYDDGVFSRTISLVENDSARYQDEFIKNYDKWHNIIDNDNYVFELSKRSAECTNEAECAQYLAEWLGKRVDFLNSQWHK